MVIYTVRLGDSLYSIAQQYGVPMQMLIDDNRLTNPEQLVVGQTIVIATDSITHTIAPGESLFSIARRYGVTVASILEANPDITNPAVIYPGQSIIIPVPDRKIGNIDVNGYAFPNISTTVLNDTLPHLTYISPFSYQVRANGSLVTINDDAIISAARAQNVAPLMVITNILEGGSFNSDLASTILNSEQIQNTVLNNVVQTLESKNYFGLDIDFEYIYSSDRQAYNQFVQRTVDRLHPLGYTVTTALAPKTRADQPGLLYEAHDYAFHGATVDHVILMTYEWGYTYSPAQAVAPLNRVEEVLRYAVTDIPSEKILMGIPNYGYDWTLPFVQGSAARTISHTAAVNLAAREGAEIMFDEEAQSPHFNYFDDQGREHEVWFEDARSIEAKLLLVDKYNLGGVSYWTVNSFFPQNWLVLESIYNVNKVL
ncbi:MAG: LysM peptidoglycan-binding domain-containing protein [Oscillospiraceae bacterium]|jgi:spore germination protein|nr:LysM peptidoglycan-binding domain-containing protein [Oscillospiraceae bacterium]